MAEHEVLVCQDLRKAFGDLVAVDGLGFTIVEGETYGLLGPNGAGKTTTISMIAGVLRKDGGQVLVDGRPITPESTKVKAAVGYVPQDLAIHPDLTARENLRFFARLYGMSRADVKHRMAEVLNMIGLTDRADGLVSTYSGGMKRRLNIGIGLMHRPLLLILDEPTAGVDPQSRRAILDSIARLAEEGIAILYTTHYMEEADQLCDRVGIIDQGRLQAEGTRRELIGLVGQHDRVTLTVHGEIATAVRAVQQHPAVQQATTAESRIELVVDDARNALSEVLAAVAAGGGVVRSVEVVEPDLEAVFLHLTGRALRD